jgi:pimeloyl-ACP methyl ester carboxylesterase
MGETRSDGVSIDYDDLGQGEPAVLCLPGWCASRAAFDDFAHKLARRRRVLALDWRGHGGSDPSPADFGLNELVRDAQAVIEASGARRVVPLATAHAGWVAIELYRALGPDRIPKLVLVDWIVTAAPPPFLGPLASLQDPTKWKATRDRLFAMWTEGVDHAGVVRFVHDDMGAHGAEMWARGAREIAAAYARAGSPLDALARLSPPPPTLHLHAPSPDPAVAQAPAAFAAAHPWFSAQPVEARSHLPTLEIPDRLADSVERFLER